jgi:hypothetical protein
LHEQDPSIDFCSRLDGQFIQPLPDEIDTTPINEVVEHPHSQLNSGNPEKQVFSLDIYSGNPENGYNNENKRPTAPSR